MQKSEFVYSVAPFGAQQAIRATQRPGSVSRLRRHADCFPWVRSFPPTSPPMLLHLCSRSSGTTTESDFSSTFVLISRSYPSMSRHSFAGVNETSQVPYKKRLRVHRVYDCVECCHTLPVRCDSFCVLLRLRTSALQNWVSQLNTEPMVSPVNTSHTTSRSGAHDSGPGRLAKPYPVRDFHPLSFASFPGVLNAALPQ